MSHRKNFLLDRIGPALLTKLAPYLSMVHLDQAQVLAETHQPVQRVYFPHTGIISCVVELRGGGAIETGMIGNDGVWGASQTLDGKISLNHVLMRVAGTASVIESCHMRQLASEHPSFRDLLIKFEQFFLAQVQQTAACNAVHSIEARACKWFLRMNDLVGPDIPLTQEFLAQMIGVRRSSVTGVAVELQRAGIISYNRGHIHITDLEQLTASACECCEDVRSHHRRIFHLIEEDASLYNKVHRDRTPRGSEPARMFLGNN
jgi:CRP-like cAMP-binding protein